MSFIPAVRIPFVEHLGLKFGTKSECSLPFRSEYANHLGSFHAAAQFALAETASGMLLQAEFPEFAERAVPILRGSEIRFKRPATSDLRAHAQLLETDREEFALQLTRRGRAPVEVAVIVRDINDIVTAEAQFQWLITLKPD